jgi:hypothetical protein
VRLIEPTDANLKQERQTAQEGRCPACGVEVETYASLFTSEGRHVFCDHCVDFDQVTNLMRRQSLRQEAMRAAREGGSR